MDTNNKKLSPVTIRICDTDAVLIIWKNSLNGNFSKIAKSILYAHQKNKSYPVYTLKSIEINEKILKTKTISISFSKNPIDIQLYDYIKSNEFSPFADDDYINAIDVSNKVKKVLLDAIGPDLIKIIESKINEYNNKILNKDMILSTDISPVSHIEEDVKTATDNYFNFSIEENESIDIDDTIVENKKEEEILENDVKEEKILEIENKQKEDKNEDVSKTVNIDSDKKEKKNTTNKKVPKRPKVNRRTTNQFNQSDLNSQLIKNNSKEN